MLQAYAVPDVRAAEEEVRAGLPDGELMRRAARGLAEVVASRHDQRGGTVVVLAGPGDNGGDALHAAALLADGGSRDVRVVGVADRLHAGGLEAAQQAGLVVHDVAPDAPELPPEVEELLAGAALVVDGLLGIGGRPGLRGAMRAAARAVPGTAYVVAVDLPSGADPEGVVLPEDCVVADETVTFGVLKPVHLMPATSPVVGDVRLVDIGVGVEAAPVVERLEPADVAGLWPVPGAGDDKYRRGVLGVIAGSADYPGAAVLCTTAALETGVGMVRYLGPERAEDLVLAACPEVVPGQGRIQAMVMGPGVPLQDGETSDRRQVQWFRQALASDVPLVVDAGALQLLAHWQRTGHLRCEAPTLLTPHAGELATLLTELGGDTVEREQVEADPVRHARRAARATGAAVLLKGATTVVADPDPRVPVRTQADAPTWLATAGAGDVLAGICGALLATGMEPRDAGAVGALVHGLAARHANPGGPVRATSVAGAVASVVAGLLTL
ncbi:bifunctional ADP-dependent NAD(P)H-hydrate dehydratase/NAD(P)H-hydrate epimerase [Serinicoccus sediminis]|uniref:bifunctional ADP-dependent NAD(P)H-hydrate dehydratase/NAD(P)H-hydrate epimerase n=1 Tax=Serinicoccus sediminis TaxID=2306021 RepID=UPI00101FD081|nr:bifunctional ADP-dependent NAD(P)H-hydrate dehydratase/NAD(P)H-hydrate epimerase [Serinicoccus sediminis]